MRNRIFPLALAITLTACGSDESAASSGFGSTKSAASGGDSTNGQGGDLFGSPSASSTDSTSTSGTTSGTGTGSGGGGGGQGGQGGGTCGSADPAGGKHAWSQISGDAEGQYALSVATDAAGNVFVAGALAGTMAFGNTMLTSAGKGDAFVAKLAPDGKALWAKRFGDAKDQSARGVAVDGAGNVIITGHFLGTINLGGATFTAAGCCFEDTFLAKFDGQGNHVWSNSFGDVNGQTPRAIAANAVGDIVIAGEFQTTMAIGATSLVSLGDNDAFVALFGSGGAVKWAKALGGPLDQSVYAVAFDAGGNVLVTGKASGSISFGGAPVAVEGAVNAFAAKLSAAGIPLWGKLFGQEKASGAGIGAGANDTVVVTGDHQGPIDFGGGPHNAPFGSDVFVVTLDAQGGYVWSRTFGDDGPQHAKGLSVTAKAIVIAGDSNGVVDFGTGPLPTTGSVDAFVAKLDSAGCGIWAKGFGDGVFQAATAVSTTPGGSAVVAGTAAGIVDFGGGALNAAGEDIFVVELGP